MAKRVANYSVRTRRLVFSLTEVLEDGDKNTREADIFAFEMVMIEVCLFFFPPPTCIVGCGEVRGSSDIHILFQVFTGMYPFSEFTVPVMISKIMSGE